MKKKVPIFQSLYSGDNKLKLLDQRYLPRWIVVLLDTLIAIVSFITVIFILRGTPIKFHEILSIQQQGLVIVAVTLCSFFVFKTYSGIIRHSTFTDITKLAFSSVLTFLTLGAFNFVYEITKGEKIFLNTSLILYMLLSFAAMLLFRIIVKETYQYLRGFSSGLSKKKVAIVGVHDDTISLGKAITTESTLPFKLVGFVTQNIESKRYKIVGKPVFPIKTSFKETLGQLHIDGVLIVSDSLNGKVKNEIVEDCLSLGLEVFNVPSMEKWNKKEDITKQIAPIQIEDLLEREEIKIDNDLIKKDISGKTVMVTVEQALLVVK
ncbi:MAG: hypothetical protein R2776_09560 [Flavobacteriaceae bacterium]